MAHSTARRTSATEVMDDQSQRSYFNNVFLVMSIGLATTGGIAYLLSENEALMSSLFNLREVTKDGKTSTEFSGGWWWWAAFAAQLAAVFFLAGRGLASRLSLMTALTVFIGYAALTGLTLAPVIYAYTTASVAKAFLLSAGTFAACAIWGLTTKRDLTPFGTAFLYALLGLIGMMIINIIFRAPFMDYVVSGAAILLFAGLTAYDMQSLRKIHEEQGSTPGTVIYGALSLYLDMLNIFIHMLQFFGVRK